MYIFEPIGHIESLGIFVSTALLSLIIIDNTAATQIFSVFQSILKSVEWSTVKDKLKTLYTLMFGASSTFPAPIEYHKSYDATLTRTFFHLNSTTSSIPHSFFLTILSHIFFCSCTSFSTQRKPRQNIFKMF